MSEQFIEVDEQSLDTYFESHFEYQGKTSDIRMSPEQHFRLFERMREQWTDYGASEPFSSVLSEDKYSVSNIDATRNQFNESGEKPVRWLKDLAARNEIVIPTGICFELGCGVGRVTKPLANMFEKVKATDISPGNLAICQQYMQSSNKSNVETILFKSPNDIDKIGKFDVFFSTIVLQHNPPPVQKYLLDNIMRNISKGGVLMFQALTYNPSYFYSVDLHLSLDKTMFEMWSIHCLPMKHIMDLFRKYDISVLEVIQDGLSRGLKKKFHSHTFFAIKNN